MPTELKRLFDDLDQSALRVRRPSRFIFFCGGANHVDPKAAASLRHYLLNERRIERRLHAGIILAEQANQLYRDTNYNDLISFEEDIARIAAMVLVIAESAGSLAELGAFAATDSIRTRLSVLLQTEFDSGESFVRYGPIRKIRNDDPTRVGVFPWRTKRDGTIIKRSAAPHYKTVAKFINKNLKRVPAEERFDRAASIQSFILILWVLHLSQALSFTELTEVVNQLIPMDQHDVKNKLYCMKLVGWVNEYPYDNKVHWYAVSRDDPFSRYRFLTGGAFDTARRKLEVVNELGKEFKLDPHVRQHVAQSKVQL